MTKAMSRTIVLTPLVALLVLSACDRGEVPSEEVVPNPDEPVSILRPDVEQPEPETEAQALAALKIVIGFPDGGAELNEAALGELKQVLNSAQLATGAPITLRAHSDAGGTVKANDDASEARGLAVAAWLIKNGVDEDRIEVIVFGAQNPIKPNALPNGEPSEKGRAANRRVEVAVVPPKGTLAKKAEPKPSDAAEPSAD